MLSRADDVVSLSATRNKPCYLGFLNEREAYILKEYLSWNSENIYFYGGYENAKRLMLCCSNRETNKEDFPIKSLFLKFRPADKLSHRDFLGSFMALGIERNCIGDILVGDGYAACYIKADIYDFIYSQISKIGKVGVQIIDKSQCKYDFKEVTELCSFIVSSLRLDVVVASITGLSRSKTSSVILSGKVFVNYKETQNISYFLNQGDILTIRGKGKFILKELVGETKKGRLKIIIEHYR